MVFLARIAVVLACLAVADHGIAQTLTQIDTGIVPAATGVRDQGSGLVLTYESAGTGAPHSHCVLQHGYVMSPDKLSAILAADDRIAAIQLFIATYYGESLVPSLLYTACDRVSVLVQEAVQSTLTELVVRTESLLATACPPEASSCAIYGHSKGGAVVTHLAARCMAQSSDLGRRGCAKMQEFYSSAGTSWGASFSPVVYGLYLHNPKAKRLQLMEVFAARFGIALDFTGAEAMAYKAGETNPVWVDMGPIGPGPNGRPVLADKTPLSQSGWLVGEYAASSTAHDFGAGRKLGGCGPWWDRESHKTCKKATRILPLIHGQTYKQFFAAGLAAMKADARFIDPVTGTTAYLDGLTWEGYQLSDGLADYALAMGPCLQGGDAVRTCKRFTTINHAANAGANPLVVADVIRAFLD